MRVRQLWAPVLSTFLVSVAVQSVALRPLPCKPNARALRSIVWSGRALLSATAIGSILHLNKTKPGVAPLQPVTRRTNTPKLPIQHHELL
jgi:hypothetical protein